MYRLPYFNSVRFLIVDPMHYLFLGIAKYLITKIWIEEGIITRDNLKTMQTRANSIQPFSDIGRLPKKIVTGDGFSNFTADQ